MLRLLSDENFNGDIIRGLFLPFNEWVKSPVIDDDRVRGKGERETVGLTKARFQWEASHWKAAADCVVN
jgi:hypothetical protein